MAKSYKQKVEKFVNDVRFPVLTDCHLQMDGEPVVITNYKPQESNFRLKEDRSKMLGDALIRTKSFVTEKVRIQVSFMLFLITL